MNHVEAEFCGDSLADLIWWLKGYRAAQPHDSIPDIEHRHLEALRLMRVECMDIITKNKEAK